MPIDQGARDIAAWIAEKAGEDPGLTVVGEDNVGSRFDVFLTDEEGRAYRVTVQRSPNDVPELFGDLSESEG